MLRSLREALAQYALGDDGDGGSGDVVQPIEVLVAALVEAIEAAEQHLLGLGFDVTRLRGAKGFVRIEALRDAKDAVCTSDEARRRFEIMARQVFSRFKAVIVEPGARPYFERHDNIDAIYRREKDRVTVEDTFRRLMELAASLDVEQRRAVEEGLSDEQLALFDLLFRPDISKTDRERLKQASRDLLTSIQALLAPMPKWFENAATQAQVRVAILDSLWNSLPRPPFTETDTETLAERVYDHVWQRSATAPSSVVRQ